MENFCVGSGTSIGITARLTSSASGVLISRSSFSAAEKPRRASWLGLRAPPDSQPLFRHRQPARLDIDLHRNHKRGARRFARSCHREPPLLELFAIGNHKEGARRFARSCHREPSLLEFHAIRIYGKGAQGSAHSCHREPPLVRFIAHRKRRKGGVAICLKADSKILRCSQDDKDITGMEIASQARDD